MRILRSAYLGLAAGVATILLTIALYLTAETCGIAITAVVLGLISLISTGIVIHLFAWRLCKDPSRPVIDPYRASFTVCLLMWMTSLIAIFWIMSGPTVEDDSWLHSWLPGLSISVSFSIYFVSLVAWQAECPQKDTGDGD